MARGDSKGVMYPNPFNETNPGEMPDVNGDSLYYTYAECQAMQMKEESFQSTPNTRASEGMLGGPSAGETNPVPLKSPQ